MQSEELRIKITQRTSGFGVLIIKLVNTFPKTPAGFALASQLVRSGTSIGANLQEAQSAASRKDFINCVNISLKEARETLYWLELINKSELITSDQLCLLIQENDEIIRILVAIVKKAKFNSALLTHNS